MNQSDTSLGRYDLLLVMMPVSLVLGGFASFVFSVSTAMGMLGGSIPACGAVWYALFVDPPADGG